jgi:limonene-1,2-epoxide hydrolase
MGVALDTVRAFIAAAEAKDLVRAAELLDPDVRYENVPVDPIVGRDETIAFLGMFLSTASEVEWKVLREIEVGDVVMNERLDRFRLDGGWLDLPVAGVFEVINGRITLWRDYFDMGTYMTQLGQLNGGSS